MFDKHYKRGKTHLENARKQKSDGHLKVALEAYQKAVEEFKAHMSSLFHDNAKMKRRLADVYIEYGDVYIDLKDTDNADACYKEALKYELRHSEALARLETIKIPAQTVDLITEFFTQDPPVMSEPDLTLEDITSTQDFVYYLQSNDHSPEQKQQLIDLALEIIELFAKRRVKTKEMTYEIIALSLIPNKEIYEEVLEQSIQAINNAILQHSKYQFGLTQVIQNAPDSLLITGDINTGNLVAILKILHTRLEDLHKQDNEDQICELLQTIIPLLDAMVRVGVKGINREQLHTPLYKQFKEISLNDNPVLAYHARYACQALLHIPNDEKLWQEVMRRTFKVAIGVITLANAVRNLDPSKLLDTFSCFSEAFAGADEIVTRIQELKEGVENIRQGMKFRWKSHWYLALRFIDIFIRENQLVKLEQFVRQSSYNKNESFLVGLCQRLEWIVRTQQDLKIQQGAVRFLGDLYQNESQWGQHSEVKKWAFAILWRLANQGNEDLQNCAKVMLKKVAPNEDNNKLDIYVSYVRDYDGQLKANPRLLIEARLKLSQNTASNDAKSLAPLEKIKGDYFSELEQDAEITNSLDLYVSPQGKWSLNTTNSFNLETEVNNFLVSEKKVLLLLGDAGAGKSTFNRYLARCLWADYSQDEPDNKFIPLFISLPAIENPNENLIQNYLKEMQFSEAVIENLRQGCKFVFILDGYDEIKDRQSHFYDKNKLNEWTAKVIISCRSEYLSTNYQRKFMPRGNSKFFQEIWIAPFSREEIQEYIRKYVEKSKEVTREQSWDVQHYETVLKRIPHLDQLLSNPFILKIAMQVMPDLIDQGSAKSITRLNLYDQFVEKWFERSQDRLGRIILEEKEKEAFKELDETDFMQHCMKFNKDLAVEMFKADEVVVKYSAADTQGQTDWRSKFLGYKDPAIRLLRYNSPLSRSGNKYRFIHKSLFEYFVARAICEAICEEVKSAIFESTLLLRDPEIIRFLTEYVQQAENFKCNLFNFIENSKTDITFQIAATNAITILTKAGIAFSGQNLNGIRISGADLSCGVFDHTQFQGADLSNVNFQRAWLRYANFTEANMSGVQFGEMPFLDHGSLCCCYSPDGRLFAIGSEEKIYLYNVNTLERIHVFEGHTDRIKSIVISSDSTKLVSGSDDNTVRLWSLKTPDQEPHIFEGYDWVFSVAISPDGTQLAWGNGDSTVRLWSLKTPDQEPRILEGHTGAVFSVAIFPDGTQLASGSKDNTVRLWSLKTPNQEPRVLKRHKHWVRSVVISPDGTQLISGSSDGTVIVWSLKTPDQEPRILEAHTLAVLSVAISLDGTKLASCSSDFTVRLWSLENLDQEPYVLEGHDGDVLSVAISPDNTQLASSSSDYTVRLWSLKTLDQELRTLEGHTGAILSLTISPDGSKLASGNSDKTVRLWSLKTQARDSYVLDGHTDYVRSVVISPDGTQLVSGSDDNTMRLWSLKIPDQEPRILKGHTDRVRTVVISPDGMQLASGGDDNMVRLWSLKTPDQELRILEGHTGDVLSLAISPDGIQLASGSEDQTVRLWSLKTPDQESRILRHTGSVRTVDISSDSSQLASGSSDGTVRLWSLKIPDQEPRILRGHNKYVSSVAFSPDDTQLASGSRDNTVRLWSMVSDHCLAIIHFPKAVYSVIWHTTKVGEFLFTGGLDKVIRSWHIEKIDDQTSRATLHWTSHQAILWTSNSLIRDVKDLSSMNMRLLKQRGAVENLVDSHNESNENQ